LSIVNKIHPHLASVKAPSLLASKQIWLLWRFEHHEGETKPRKVPYYVNGSKRYGVQGRLEDRQNLVTFEAARAAAVKRGFDGIGHACLDGDFTVVDFDRCAVNGKLNPVIEALASDTYAEYSPSGEGIHLYVKGNLHNSNVKSAASNDQFGIELFATKGFVTFTGNTLEITDMLGVDDTLADPSPDLKTLVHQRFGREVEEFSQVEQAPLGVSLTTIKEALDVLDPDMGHEDWLRVGLALHHETGGEGFALWDHWSAKGSKYPGDGFLQNRWDSFGKNPGKVVTFRSLAQMANNNGARIILNAISMEDFENLADDPPIDDLQPITDIPPEPIKTRFPVIPAAEFAVRSSWGYVIKGVLPKAALAVLFGESGSGKSFVMLDMALAIARGEAWRGHRTTSGRVVYLVAEGANGFRNRLIAWSIKTGIDLSTLPLDIIDATPNLLLKDDALDICKSILASGPRPSVVIVDTFAQVLAGANENASEDMGKALSHCKGMHKALGSLILLVHHSGKDSSKGARGWSGLRAAADAELEVIRSPLGRTLRTTKQKDGADFKEWGFDLEVVPLGEDQDGDVITSCVVVQADVPLKNMRKVGKNEQIILNALAEISLAQTAGIEIDALIQMAIDSLPAPEDGKRDTRKQHIKQAFNKLSDDENPFFIIEDDNTLTILN